MRQLITLNAPGCWRRVHQGPATAYQFYSLSVALEGLLHLDEHARLQPRLAESWSNPDPRTYVFKLRRGVTFWDGSPLTAQDVVYLENFLRGPAWWK